MPLFSNQSLSLKPLYFACLLSLSLGITQSGFYALAAIPEETAVSPANSKKGFFPSLRAKLPGQSGQKISAIPMMEISPELDLDATQETMPVKEGETAAPDASYRAKAVVVDVNSKNLTYDTDRDVYIATGAVHVVISEQNSELFADQVIYDQNQNLLIAEGHVIIHKNGDKTNGSYAKIDLTRQSALINDITTTVDQVRIKAQQAMVANDHQIFENGRLILTPQMMSQALDKNEKKGPVRASTAKAPDKEATIKPGDKGKKQPIATAKKDSYDPFSEFSLANGVSNDPLAASISEQRTLASETVDLQSANTQADNWENDFFHLKAKDINIYRWQDGYTKVDVKNPSLYAGRFKLAGLTNTQFSQNPFSEEMEYLGPDLGYDPDMGGFYYGPGYDFRLGNGSIRFNPMLSYGGGRRKRRGSDRFEQSDGGPGIGGAVHYQGDNSKIDLSYNSSVGQPVMYAEKMLFDKKTRIIGTVNEDYVNGFMGFERPGFGVMLADSRKLAEFGKFRVDSFASAGVFKDDFFPNNQTTDFVDVDYSQSPATAGRVQFQAQLANTKPLLSIGDWMNVGFRAQVAMAGYTTGDLIGIIRGGPTMTLKYKDRFRTSLRYFYAQTAGETPFIFDEYYYGRQQLGVTNQVKVNQYLTLGLRSQLSLNRDNASNALFTGNQLFMLVGPKYVKFNIAYDVVRQRSYFGLMLMPGKEGRPIDYDTLRVFSPDQYYPDEN